MNLDTDNFRVVFAVILVLNWIFLPLFAQLNGYSAIKVSFAVTVFYFVGWKFLDLLY